jgi:hypothetical protein
MEAKASQQSWLFCVRLTCFFKTVIKVEYFLKTLIMHSVFHQLDISIEHFKILFNRP